jgi:hypothetical protein
MTAYDEWLREQIAESFDDPEPNVPAAEVFRRLREYHADQLKVRSGTKSKDKVRVQRKD